MSIAKLNRILEEVSNFQGESILSNLSNFSLEDDEKKSLRIYLEVTKQDTPSRELLTNLSHSSLILWLLSGEELLPFPPPLYYSRPWHSLIKEGRGEVYDVYHNLLASEDDFCYKKVIICHDSRWDLIGTSEDQKILFLSFPTYPEYRWKLESHFKTTEFLDEMGRYKATNLTIYWVLERI